MYVWTLLFCLLVAAATTVAADASDPSTESSATGTAETNAATSVVDLPDESYGESKRCLQSTQIQDVEVLSDRLLVFRTGRNKIWVNQLPVRCPSLDREVTIAFTSNDPRLCAKDSVRVLFDNPRAMGGSEIIPWIPCQLGNFEAITAQQRIVLREQYIAKTKNPLEDIFGEPGDGVEAGQATEENTEPEAN